MPLQHSTTQGLGNAQAHGPALLERLKLNNCNLEMVFGNRSKES